MAALATIRVKPDKPKKEPTPLNAIGFNIVRERLRAWCCSHYWIDYAIDVVRYARQTKALSYETDGCGKMKTKLPRLLEAMYDKGVYPPAADEGRRHHSYMAQCVLCERQCPSHSGVWIEVPGICADCAINPTRVEISAIEEIDEQLEWIAEMERLRGEPEREGAFVKFSHDPDEEPFDIHAVSEPRSVSAKDRIARRRLKRERAGWRVREAMKHRAERLNQ